MKLSDAAIRKLEAPAKGYRIAWDDEVAGFGCRITAAGVKSFILNYRTNGRERRLTIGRFPDWSVTAARDEARRLGRQVDVGDDPMASRQAARQAETVAELCALYAEKHLPKNRPSTRRDATAIMDAYILPELGRLKVAEVRHLDIERLHRRVTANGPTRANRVASVLSKMFSLAVKWGIRHDNPVKGLERNPEIKRQRFLSPEELQRLAGVLSRYSTRPSARALMLLLLTGARRGEVLGATWDQFDLAGGI